jgi:hypothetical protein
MATKAEKWQVRAERAAQNKNLRLKKKRRRSKRAEARAERSRKRARAALVERSDRAPARVPHNTAPRAGAKSAYALEATASGRPSRKSTRKSPAHLKRDRPLRNRLHKRTLSPEARAGRRARRRRAAPTIVRPEEE